MKHLQQTILSLILACLIVAPVQAATQMYFIHNDHLATPQVVTDQNQAVVWQGHQTPFGVVEETTATVEQLSRFPGQYFDEESGLSYNYFRDYDPSTGRYVQSDPIGILRDYSDPQLQVAISMGIVEETDFAGEVLNHTYGYVGQNPLYWFDPWGLAEHDSNKTPSNKNKHENANSRRNRDKGGEKGDKNRRPPNKKPPGHKGPWPGNLFKPKNPLFLLPIDPGLITLPIDPFKDIPKDC